MPIPTCVNYEVCKNLCGHGCCSCYNEEAEEYSNQVFVKVEGQWQHPQTKEIQINYTVTPTGSTKGCCKGDEIYKPKK